jgi:putative hemolysin
MPAAISLLNLVSEAKPTFIKRFGLNLLDKLLAIDKLDALYTELDLHGLAKHEFAERLLHGLNINVQGLAEFQSRIPKQGPLVLASNHPFGGIEGVLLAWAIHQVRPDIKVMANRGLRIFPELSDFFIFANPLASNDPQNGPAIRACLKHLNNGGALLVFPAGRVSYYHGATKRIADHPWNRLVASLQQRSQASVVPVFVSGFNSRWFYRLGRIYYRLRMLMLPRELLNKRHASIHITAGFPVSAKDMSAAGTSEQHTLLLRQQCYLQDPSYIKPWPADPVSQLKPLLPATDPALILSEIRALAPQQCLLEHKGLSVYYGYQHQLVNTVTEIARLRELVFRQHNEGSGEPLDTDRFDATYTHLFVVNMRSGQIIGAYRMGQTDKLLADGNLENLYLHKMFNFGPDFINRQQPCLEMGRSFLIPEYQRSFQGLYLLWRGIGAFVCQFPHYRTLYGTVSISKLYDPRSVALIQQAMVTPTQTVSPRTHFAYTLPPEVQDFCTQQGIRPNLAALLKSLEADGKDVPILLKHYEKLGATFHCLGIDSSFNDTPGLLLSVDLPSAPEKLLKLYLAEAWQAYVRHPSL